MYTVPQLAAEIGLKDRSVRRWCLKLGFKKTGRDYLLSIEEVAMIRILHYPKRGRPANS